MQSRKKTAIDVFVALTIGASLPLMAQQPAPANEVLEEVVVTGSQIRGAVISDALPISIVGSETIEVFGIDSGDQLLDLIPENGNNFVNEVANISGGVNSAGGDVGAFNLRSLGTGNTLLLINGRRIKLRYAHMGGRNPPTIIIHGNQTESVPGSYRRYLSDFYRKSLKLVGTPVVIELRQGENPFEGRRNVLTARQVKKRQRLREHIRKRGG